MPNGVNWLSSWFADHYESLPADALGAMLARGADRLVDGVLGQQQADEIRALLQAPPGHTQEVATVLLPGIMCSLLSSVRGTCSPLWFNATVLANGKLNLLDLSADGEDDAAPDMDIVPTGIEKIFYLRMILTLARETRLFEFPYDWRRRLEWNAEQLHGALLRWERETPGRPFVLVGHSMGGLLARTYLALYPAEAERLIAKVILIGSPLYGAAQVASVLAGQEATVQIVTRLHPDNDVLRFVRNLPTVYQLLPPPPEFFPSGAAYPFNWDAYDARAWGLPLRQDYLDAARGFHQMVLSADPQVETWQIAGCHQPTECQVIHGEASEPDQPPDYTPIVVDCGPEAGDNRVPLWSVKKEGITTVYVPETHQGLPANADVLDAVVKIAHGEQQPLLEELPAAEAAFERSMPLRLMDEVRDLGERIKNRELTPADLRKLFFAG